MEKSQPSQPAEKYCAAGGEERQGCCKAETRGSEKESGGKEQRVGFAELGIMIRKPFTVERKAKLETGISGNQARRVVLLREGTPRFLAALGMTPDLRGAAEGRRDAGGTRSCAKAPLRGGHDLSCPYGDKEPARRRRYESLTSGPAENAVPGRGLQPEHTRQRGQAGMTVLPKDGGRKVARQARHEMADAELLC